MITCKSCKKKIATNAKICPHCGWDRGAEDQKNVGNVIVVFALIIIVAAVIEKYIF